MLAHMTIAEIGIPHFLDPVSWGPLPAGLAHAECLPLAEFWKFLAPITDYLIHPCVKAIEEDITQSASWKLLFVSTIDAIRYRESQASVHILVHDFQPVLVLHVCFYKLLLATKPVARIAYEQLILQRKAGLLSFRAFLVAEWFNELVEVAVHHPKIHIVREIELVGND